MQPQPFWGSIDRLNRLEPIDSLSWVETEDGFRYCWDSATSGEWFASIEQHGFVSKYQLSNLIWVIMSLVLYYILSQL